MVAPTQQNKPAATPAAAAKSSSPSSEGTLKKELRGMSSYDAQAARLAPEGSAARPEAGQTSSAEGAAARDTKKAAPTPQAKSFGDLDPGNRLAGLHPTFADSVRKVASIARGKGLDVFVAQGMRTHAEQNALYAQGRTKKGPVVTWVRGGSSYHNYGLGADFAFHGGAPYSEKHDWKGLVASVRDAGLVSGASYGDRPHANLGVPMKSLQAWHKKGGLRHVWDQVSEQYGGPRFGAGDGATDKVDEKTGPGTTSGKSGTYTVRSGDTLIEIAERLLGDGSRWNELAQLNGIRDARELAVGRVLRLPTGPAAKKDVDTDVGGEAKFRQRSHTVRAGETLSQIALRHYGMGSLWQAIATANGIVDPTKLEVGQKLTIPPQGEAKSSGAADKKVVPQHHVVARGETLGEIADTYYGNFARWTDIAKANRISDPRSLKVGAKLVLPQ